jgi:hypothetical protein
VPAFRGSALTWWCWWHHYHPQANWEAFIVPFLWHFKPEYRDVLPLAEDGDVEEFDEQWDSNSCAEFDSDSFEVDDLVSENNEKNSDSFTNTPLDAIVIHSPLTVCGFPPSDLQECPSKDFYFHDKHHVLFGDAFLPFAMDGYIVHTPFDPGDMSSVGNMFDQMPKRDRAFLSFILEKL